MPLMAHFLILGAISKMEIDLKGPGQSFASDLSRLSTLTPRHVIGLSNDPVSFGAFPDEGGFWIMPSQRLHHRNARHHRIARPARRPASATLSRFPTLVTRVRLSTIW